MKHKSHRLTSLLIGFLFLALSSATALDMFEIRSLRTRHSDSPTWNHLHMASFHFLLALYHFEDARISAKDNSKDNSTEESQEETKP